MLSVAKSFVEFVEKRPGGLSIGIITTGGHGLASKSGSLYFVPGDVDSAATNRTKRLSETKLNCPNRSMTSMPQDYRPTSFETHKLYFDLIKAGGR